MAQNTTHIIGAIGDAPLSLQDVAAILQQDDTELGHEGEFIGKTTTHLKFNHQHVLKLHPNRKFSSQTIASQWLNNLLKQEREAKVYHPSRTWFIYLRNKHWYTGNITCRLTPLHLFFEQDTVDSELALQYIETIAHMYFSFSQHCDKRLDEGLSNFGIEEQRIYYLDDDIFDWDHFHAFSAWLAGWLRKYTHTWLTAEVAGKLGQHLQGVLHHYFHQVEGIDAPHIISEQLKAMFFPSGNIQEAADHIMAALEKQAHNTTEVITGIQSDDIQRWFEDDEPIAILSDIHANLPALQAVLYDIDHQGISRIFALGDLVGYGPHPEKCLNVIRERGILSLRGNHDHAIGTGNMVYSMTSSSSHVAEWTIRQLDMQKREYLHSLPLKIGQRPWMAVHGAPIDPTCFNGYIYHATALNNLRWMQEHSYKYCLHGHSHYQGIYVLRNDNELHFQEVKAYHLLQEQAALICPGSVGQPRDGTTHACYAVIHPQQAQVELKRVPYDVRDTIHDMIIEQFPEQLIQRLKAGT